MQKNTTTGHSASTNTRTDTNTMVIGMTRRTTRSQHSNAHNAQDCVRLIARIYRLSRESRSVLRRISGSMLPITTLGSFMCNGALCLLSNGCSRCEFSAMLLLVVLLFVHSFTEFTRPYSDNISILFFFWLTRRWIMKPRRCCRPQTHYDANTFASASNQS